jgi:hypothetical protein
MKNMHAKKANILVKHASYWEAFTFTDVVPPDNKERRMLGLCSS